LVLCFFFRGRTSLCCRAIRLMAPTEHGRSNSSFSRSAPNPVSFFRCTTCRSTRRLVWFGLWCGRLDCSFSVDGFPETTRRNHLRTVFLEHPKALFAALIPCSRAKAINLCLSKYASPFIRYISKYVRFMPQSFTIAADQGVPPEVPLDLLHPLPAHHLYPYFRGVTMSLSVPNFVLILP